MFFVTTITWHTLRVLCILFCSKKTYMLLTHLNTLAAQKISAHACLLFVCLIICALLATLLPGHMTAHTSYKIALFKLNSHLICNYSSHTHLLMHTYVHIYIVHMGMFVCCLHSLTSLSNFVEFKKRAEMTKSGTGAVRQKRIAWQKETYDCNGC